MSLSSSLNAGVAGLLTNATKLATISDNIANSSTPGYRRATVEFASLVTADANTSRYSAAGVRSISFRDVETSGSLSATNNSTDLAISGNGMLPVTEARRVELPPNERPFMLTPTGSFRVNENGFLVSQSGLALLGFQTDSSGNLASAVVRDSTADLEPVQVSPFINAAQQTSSIALGVNLPARETIESANFPNNFFESPLQYFSSIGSEQTLTVRYVPADPGAGNPPSNAWTLEFYDTGTPGNAIPGTDPALSSLDLTFDDTAGGVIATVGGANVADFDPLTGILTVQASGGDVPIEVFIGSPDPDVVGGLTQLDAEFAPTNIIKDGAPAGTLSSLEVDAQGTLLGVYDTGQRVALYRIPIADVPNWNGLQALSSQAFALTPQSGNVFLHDANTGPVGSIESFALQQSTVDIARELTDLISTQRAYSSNATVIQTVDEMLQETTNIKR